jgi:hypothetical protein
MKQIAGFEIYQVLLFVLLLVGASVASASVFPSRVAADATVATYQAIPPGGNACTQLAVSDFKSYVYDNSLESFDFSINDASYVAVTGTVGDTPVPFSQMTRRVESPNSVRIHVDIASQSVTSDLPITVTLFSSKGGGQPVCVSVVSALVQSQVVQNVSAETQPVTAFVPVPGETPQVDEVIEPSSVTSESSATPTEWKSGVLGGLQRATDSVVATFASNSAVNSVQSSLQNACATIKSANRVWLVLLVLYVLIVGLLIFAQWPVSWTWIRMPEWVSAIILVPLVLLLGFWYFSIDCRTEWWMPGAAVVIAIVGLITALREHPSVKQLSLLETPKK